jgi:hypothetical protein
MVLQQYQSNFDCVNLEMMNSSYREDLLKITSHRSTTSTLLRPFAEEKRVWRIARRRII